MLSKRLALAAASLALMVAAARAGDAPPAADREAVARGDNDFALDLYGRLARGDADANLFFSPLSIETALAMTHEGARGATAAEIEKALRFPFADARLGASFQSLASGLDGGGAAAHELAIANALWVEKKFALLPAFLETAHARYGAAAEPLDFDAAPEPARKRINAWVEERTKEKVKDLLPQGSVTSDTRLVLTNAIYFKGKWEVEFKKAATRDEPFQTAAGPKPAPFMHRRTRPGESPRYAEDDLVQALELPHRGKGVAMVFLLPKKADGLAALEKALAPERLAAWLGALRPAGEVDVALPRFHATRAVDLVPHLRAMGVRSALSAEAADFSGMDGAKDLYLTGVFHKAFVDVNEEGTEAAAATGGSVGTTAVHEPRSFRADHPFIFLIRDLQTGAVLFMGRVADPTA